MIKLILVGIILNIATEVIHSIGADLLIWLMARPMPLFINVFTIGGRTLILILTVGFLLSLLGMEILIWAISYSWIVPKETLPTFDDAIYFSATTFTTTGDGDITLTSDLRFLSGMEAVNGILLCGWSTALLFAVVQRLLTASLKRNPHLLKRR